MVGLTVSQQTEATGSVSIAVALQALEAFEAQYEGIDVIGALLNSDYDPNGNLYDTVDVSFAIVGRPGTYTVSVPLAENWQAIAFYHIGLKAQQVELIYEGAPDGSVVPDVPFAADPTTNPTPIPLPGQPIYT